MPKSESPLLVREYYRLVDANEFAGLVSLFAEDAEYDRPGYNTIFGREALRRFYLDERVIERGEHRIESILTEGREVVAFGDFIGVAKSGEPLRVGFCDRFLFESGSIQKRTTYFFQPAV